MAISVFLKKIIILNRFLIFNKILGDFLVILTVITSFSFFSSNAISYSEKEWRAIVSKEINYRIYIIEEQEKILIAEAIINDELFNQIAEKNTKIINIFRSAAN